MSEYRAPCSKCSCLYEFLSDVLFTLDLMGDAKAYANSMFTISTEPRVSVGWVWKDSLEKIWRGRIEHNLRAGFWFCIPLCIWP